MESKHLCHAEDVIGPVPLAAQRQFWHVHRHRVTVAMENDARVLAQSQSDAYMPVDRCRQAKTLVVVRVVADDIDASRRDGHGARGIAKRLPEGGSGLFIQLVSRAHDIRAKSQSSPSVGLAAVGRSGSVRPSRSNRQVRMPMVGRRLRKASAISDRVPRPPPMAITPSAVLARIGFRLSPMPVAMAT